MGILFPPFQRLENANVLFPEGLHVPYYGNRAPEEASRAPEDSKTWYADFQEDAACVPHKDGRQIIVYWIPQEIRDARVTSAWAVNRLKRMYERLSGDHPRIVRYNGMLDGIIGGEYNDKIGGLLLEKLTPGPMCMTVPNMTVPITSSSPQEDRIVLSLYYRWALQILSAISFLHSHRIILNACGDLGSRWLRPDFSIALTGFVNAMIVPEGLDTLSFSEFSQEHMAEEPDEDTDYRCGEYSCYSEDGKDMIGVKSDLFQWATFVWRLMTGSEQAMVGWPWEPSSPKWDDPTADYGQNRDSLEYAIDQRHLEGLWQELEEERLGKVLIKAWNGGYESADDVMEDIKEVAKKIGMDIVGDEVDIGRPWQDVFEVVEKEEIWDRELRFKPSAVNYTDEEWVEI